MKIKKILWPTDFSKASLKALDAAIELADQFSAEILAVNIIGEIPAAYGYPGAGSFNVAMYQEELEKNNKERLRETLDQNIKKNIKTSTKVLHGREADEIVKAADENQADLIVISTHGFTGLKRLLLGSVAEAVIRHADQPVLTIRITEEDEAGW